MIDKNINNDSLKSEIVDQTNKMIINDYINYMKKYEEWDRDDAERFLSNDPFAEIPESFSQSYYADMSFVLHASLRED